MKNLTITIICTLFLGFSLFGQRNISDKAFNQVEMYGILNASNFKSTVDYYSSRPDSVIRYYDSLETSICEIEYFNYEESKVVYTSESYIKSIDSIINYEKIEYYLDNTIPALKYDPYFHYFNYGSGDPVYNCIYYPSVGDTTAVYYKWDTTLLDWINKVKIVRTLNNQGVNELSNTYQWDTITLDWVFNSKAEQIVHSQSPDTLELRITPPDTVNYIWELDYIFHYNSSNQLVKQEKLGDHLPELDTFIYDEKGRLIEFTTEWDDFFFDKFYYFYDDTDRLHHIHNYYKDLAEDEYEYYDTKFFYYSNNPSANNNLEIESNSVSLFPNPTNDYIQLKNYNGRLQLIDLAGVSLMDINYNAGNQINVGELSSGLYFAKTTDGKLHPFIKK